MDVPAQYISASMRDRRENAFLSAARSVTSAVRLFTPATTHGVRDMFAMFSPDRFWTTASPIPDEPPTITMFFMSVIVCA